MANIQTFDPGSTEAKSPLIAGLTEGLNKISGILNMGIGVLTDVQLTSVPISDTDKNRIYQANMGNRLWLDNPAPVFKKNGIEITKETDGFEIDYVGGSISFSENSRLQDTDVVTVTCSYIVNSSKTIADIQTAISAVTELAVRYKGAYNTVEELNANQLAATDGDFALVLSSLAFYAVKDGVWGNTQSIEDLSNYYTKQEVNNIADTKQPTISPKGETAEDDNFYYGGRKTWQDVNDKVRNTTLSGIDTASSDDITDEDTVLSGLGKMQGKATDYDTKVVIIKNEEPNENTVGHIGQRYVNASNGHWYTCVAIDNNTYTWETYVPTKELENYLHAPFSGESGVVLKTKSTDVLAPSWEGRTTVIGAPSPDNPATITGVPFQATATGPNGESRNVDLGITGYSLPNGAKDTYDGKTGAVVHKIIKLELNGTENIVKRAEEAAFEVFFSYGAKTTVADRLSLVCTHFTVTDYVKPLPTNCMRIAGSENPHNSFWINWNNNTDLAAFKSFLAAQAAAGTPVTILYELAEPIAYNQKADLRAFDGQTTVTGAEAVDVIDDSVLRFAEIAPFEVVRSNCNILNNFYLMDPINQRGQAEYATNGYTIDRWFTTIKDISVKITTNGIQLNTLASGKTYAFYQEIENEKLIKNRLYIVSFLIDNSLYYHTFFYSGNDINIMLDGTTKIEGKGEFGAYINSVSGRLRVSISVKNPNVLTIQAAKLELGDKQTLARKIGDQWVLNDPPPDPALALLKCQRYFQIFATESLRPTDKDDFRPTMRATPALGTFIINGKTYYTASAEL